MSAEFIHVDQAHDAMAGLIKELHAWKELADRLYNAVCCEQAIRKEGYTGANRCEQCSTAVGDYWRMNYEWDDRLYES